MPNTDPRPPTLPAPPPPPRPPHAPGAKERGELESRVTKLIAEVKEAANIILM